METDDESLGSKLSAISSHWIGFGNDFPRRWSRTSLARCPRVFVFGPCVAQSDPVIRYAFLARSVINGE